MMIVVKMAVVFWVMIVPSTSDETTAATTMPPYVAGHWDALYSESVHSTVVKDFGSSWQGADFTALRGVLGPRLNEASKDLRFLVLGAGDSSLPEDLFDAGWHDITAIDFSSVVVNAMADRTERRPGLRWFFADARKLSLPEDSFDVAIDVGMLDTVAIGGSDQATKVLLEVHRVLRAGGGYISVSTEPPLFRQPLFAQHPPGGWVTEVLTLPRPREIDPRVRALDPVISPGKLHPMLDVGRINVYVSKVPGGSPALPFPDLAEPSEQGAAAAETVPGDTNTAEAAGADAATAETAAGAAATEATPSEAAADAPVDAASTSSQASDQPPADM